MEITDPMTRQIDFIDQFERDWLLVDADGVPVLADKNYTDAFGNVFSVDLGSVVGEMPNPVLVVRWKRLHGAERSPWAVGHPTVRELMPDWQWVRTADMGADR